MARNGNDLGLNDNPNGFGLNDNLNEEEGVSDVEPVETNPANEENAPIASEEEPEKTESVSIETDREDKKEVNPSVAPLMDSSAAFPLNQ
ncbi:hypothetical protein J1N35_025258 [Gossypium stocksii]|uniref:Uncharacterized protein n=1 Tax=Gossypium stocksii TaxID=47602 RepID=A0A9D3ZW10_9ROSI|nr:hypothetical protein J1N35_025258 [Gossypium stocksii]